MGQRSDLCASLPLALAIVAARIQTRAAVPLPLIAEELDDAGERLDLLTTEDATTGPRAVFSWSYAALSQPAARVFRLLGLHPGPDISTNTIASLAGLPRSDARRAVEELTRANLLTEHLPQRYRLHSLLHTYATELVRAFESDHERAAATRRLLDHYLQAAYAADRAIESHRDPIPIPPPVNGVAVDQLVDMTAAVVWFDAEHENLAAALHLAAEQHLDTYTWSIAWACGVYFYRTSRTPIWINLQREVIEACQRPGDTKAEAVVTQSIAELLSDLGQYEESLKLAYHARAMVEELGDLLGIASTELLIAYTRTAQGKLTEAIRRNRAALEIYREFDRKPNQAGAYCNLATAYAQLGEHQRAIDFAEQAFALAKDTGDVESLGDASRALGYTNLQHGAHQRAVECYRRAVEMYRAIRDRRREALARTGLGNAKHAAGEEQRAHTDWQKALLLFEEINHPNANAIKTKLATNPQRANTTFTPSGRDPEL